MLVKISGHHWVLQDPPVLHAGDGYPEFSVLVPTVFFVMCVSILVPSSLSISGYHWVLQDPPVLHAGDGYPEFSVLVPTVFL